MNKKTLFTMMALGITNAILAAEPIIPADSKIGKSDISLQKLLINPMEQNGVIHKGAWHMSDLSEDPAKVSPKAGSTALALQGTADIKGGKGDFVLANNPPGKCRFLGTWVYLDKSSNVEKLGLQVYDAEGEALMATVPASWEGWKWIEFELNADNFKQAYDQKDKNSTPDVPLKSVNFVWFSAAPGKSTCIVDGLVAASEIEQGTRPPLMIDVSKNDWGENNTPFKTDLFLTNYTDKPASCTVNFSIQEDSRMFSEKAPDPVLGSDHALGVKSWVEVEGKKIEDNSLTDGDDGSSFGTDYRKEYYTEAFEYVDLGTERNIKRIDFKSGDANWCWRLDILASSDGKNYQPVQDLQNVNMLKRWGQFTIGPKTPFNARFLKLHFKGREGQKENVIRMPAAILVYDGAADENMNIPKVGTEIDKGSETVLVPPRSFAMVTVASKKPLVTGGYFVGLQAKYGNVTQVFYKNYFIMPKPLKNVTADSRFGVNASTPALAEFHNRMGLGWVRFENMKWAMICPEKDKYAFDGSVKPWVVPEDQIVKDYTQKYKLNYLPYVFQTPRWASSAPDKHKNSRGFPPKDYNDYGTCIYQIVARYGSKKHPDDKLLTNDKISGMNMMKVIELWNEPNLVGESWAPWVAPIEKHFDIFRIGAEAAKKADPNISVTSCGWAGILLDVIGKMETYKYPDGKTPVDFTDILNVHYYSGKADPERATVDRNVMRGSKPAPGERTYEDNLRDLVSWWHKVKPGNKPIWLTETGYDVGGPIGRDERYQAAKLPRCTMMAMAAGIDKVFIYREKGSNPAQHAGAGFLRNDNSVRPSWFAFATLVRQLHGVKPDKVLSLHIPGNDEIWAYLWDRNGKKVFSVWALDDKSKLPLNLGKCTVTDSFGREKKMNVNGDLQLSIFPIYITDISNIEPVNQLVNAAEAKDKARVEKQKRLAALRKYLFDFGSREEVGILKNYGPAQRFTAVLAEDIYDSEKGYGFETKGMENQSAKWIADLLDKDSVKIGKHTFIFNAKPGKYQLVICGTPFAQSEKVTIKGISGGEKTLEITKKDSKTSLDIQVTNIPISISFSGYANLRWLTLIEKE